MANTKVTQHVIADDAITTAMITDGNVTVAKLPSTVDLSSKTLTLPAVTIPSASTATTQSASDNSTKVATTAYVETAISNLVDSSPSSLNTLNELAAALNDDASFSTTVTNSIATKLPLAGGTMTGAIQLNANDIDSTSTITLDAATDIILDSDGGDILLKDGGTQYGQISNSSLDLRIISIAQDKDLILRGNDGGSYFNALTLDMSEAGFATFNDGGVFGGTGALRIPQGTTGQRPTAATGQIRWNTTDGALEIYNGSAWTAVGTGSSNKILDTFTGDDSTTDFTLSVTPANEDALMVFIDGVYQEKGDYVLTNAVLALDTAPAAGEKIACHITTASVHDGTSAVNQQFTATSGQTAFTLSQDPKSENNTQVYINGVYQQKTDYTVSGTTLTFDTGLTVGDVVEVNMFTVATLGNTDTVSEGSSNLYHTTARARSAISVSGNALSYNSSTGVISSSYEESPTFTTLEINKGSAGEYLRAGGYSSNARSLVFTNSTSSGGSASALHTIKANSTAGEIAFANGDGTIMYLKDGGNVGIGTTSPQEKLHIFNSAQTWNQYANIRMSTESDSYAAEIGFHRGTSDDSDRGLFLSGDGTNKHVRILHGGNVGIGTDSPATKLDVNGSVRLTDSTYSIYSSSASAVIGHIGNTANDLNIYSSTSGHNGLRFHVNGILPTDNSGTIIDNDADLGDPGYRFKDIYLSGGVNFSANSNASGMTSETLDDYEEGTWTPTLTASSGNYTLNSAYDTLGYTRVGRIVTITGQLVISASNSPSGTVTFGDLPFEMLNATKRSSQTRPSIHIYANGSGAPASAYYSAFIAFNEGNRSGTLIITYNNTHDATPGDWLSAGSDLFINFAYHAA